MSKNSYETIRKTIQHMLEIEFNSNIKDMEDVLFFIDDEHNKLIVKNYDCGIDIVDSIGFYFNVNNYEYIQQFQYLYNFNECEIVEFDLEL